MAVLGAIKRRLREREYRRGYSHPIKDRFDVWYCGECNYQFPVSDGVPDVDFCDCDDDEGPPGVIHVYAERTRLVYE